MLPVRDRPNLLAALWGIAGVLALLVNATISLGVRAVEAIRGGLSPGEWALVVASIAFNGYFEGYRAFQLQFAPRVVARALYLARRPRPLHVLLAPLYCMALFHATRRRLITSWIIVFGVVGLVMIVRLIGQPWRGIIDVGVAMALAWGVGAIVVFAARAARGVEPPIAADVPADPGFRTRGARR